MKTVKVKDKEFRVFIKNKEIQKTVDKIAKQISKDMEGKIPLFLIILNGAFVFASDLLRRLDFNCQLSFVKLASYVGTESSEKVRELLGLDQTLKDRSIVIVEDIIDTGITMEYTINKLKELEVEEVKIASLLFKPMAFKKDFHIDYIGMEIPDDFVIGYGLDYDGFGRNYPDIYKIVE